MLKFPLHSISDFNTFKMLGSAGDLRVQATITSYSKEALKKAGIDEYVSKFYEYALYSV